MEDIQLITYIIFAVLYLIFKVMQKKKEPGQDPTADGSQQPRQPRKPAMTFEEMLREFSGEPPVETVEEAQPNKKPVTQAKEPEPQKKYFSYETEYDENAQKTYQESIERGRRAKTLDEQVDIENINIKVGKLQVIEDDQNVSSTPTHEYLEGFKTLEGAKKAFVYSEIFNRKYN